MSVRLDNLIEQIKGLSPDEFAELQKAVEEKRWTDDDWDRQMRADAEAGKLDYLIAEAREEYAAGRTRPFPE